MNLSQVDRTDGEIDWPSWASRTSSGERKRTSKFKVPMGQAIRDVRNELLERIDADAWRISTAAAHRKKDGLPYADANPTDPGVVIRWTKEGEQYAVACDHYTDLRDNVRAIGLHLREKRKMADRPVVTGQDEFATARLPEGDPDRDGITRREPHEILEVSPDASPAIIKAAARRKMANESPDTAGDRDEFIRIQKARDRMLQEAVR